MRQGDGGGGLSTSLPNVVLEVPGGSPSFTEVIAVVWEATSDCLPGLSSTLTLPVIKFIIVHEAVV